MFFVSCCNVNTLEKEQSILTAIFLMHDNIHVHGTGSSIISHRYLNYFVAFTLNKSDVTAARNYGSLRYILNSHIYSKKPV